MTFLLDYFHLVCVTRVTVLASCNTVSATTFVEAGLSTSWWCHHLQCNNVCLYV